jgi:hypothetical protein
LLTLADMMRRLQAGLGILLITLVARLPDAQGALGRELGSWKGEVHTTRRVLGLRTKRGSQQTTVALSASDERVELRATAHNAGGTGADTNYQLGGRIVRQRFDRAGRQHLTIQFGAHQPQGPRDESLVRVVPTPGQLSVTRNLDESLSITGRATNERGRRKRLGRSEHTQGHLWLATPDQPFVDQAP